MATSLQERLKLKQYQVDTWTPREQLCLASAVMRSGDQNWVAVSRTIKTLTTETNRPLDWYSTKNCALMYAKLLEKVDAPKRKRERGEPTNTNVETPGEIVTKMLAKQRIEELRVLEAQSRTSYNHLRQQIQHLEAGMLDHTLDAEWEAFVRERKEEEEKERLHREWLKQREEKIHAIQKALKHQIPKVPLSTSSTISLNKKIVGRQSWPSTSSSERRDSGMSDNSELDLALDSPGISSPMVEESQQLESETKPVPTSPLLSSLLSKPPNPPGSSNVATDLRNSFNLASSRGRVGLTPNVSSALQNLVSSAISGTDATLKDHQKNTTTSPGSAAPTLSRLLELPPRPPGDPMPSITDLPPTHAETMAQVHKSSPPELKKPKLDIEALAAEAAESLLSDTLLNDLDDQLDDEGMDEEEERKKEEELSSVSITPPETGSQEGGKTREHQNMEMSETDVKSSSKLLGGKPDTQKCSGVSSPEANADVPLEEDKKGEETEQVGDKRKEEKEVEKQKSTDTQHVEQDLLDKEKVNEKEREEFYKIKKVVVEITDIMKDKKIENMTKKSESYNNEEKKDENLKEINKETENEIEKNNSNEEQKGGKYNAQCADKDKIENVTKEENVEKGNTEKGNRKIEGSHKRKAEGKEGERYKHRRSDKKKDKRNDKEHKKSKKNKKYKHKDKTEESEKDESEKESKDKERRSDKERNKDKKSEKEKKVKEKHKENKNEREKHKDKKEVEKGDKYQKENKHDKYEITGEKKHDKHKSKHESEKSQIKVDVEIFKIESDKEKDNEECNDRHKEKKIKSKNITDIQGETDKNEKLDKTKKTEVENETGNCTENIKESKKLEIHEYMNQSNKLSDNIAKRDLSELVDNSNNTSEIVKTENIESSSFVSYADKLKTPKKISETNITKDHMDSKKNNKEIDKISKVIASEITLDSKNVEQQDSISEDEEMESKENNCNVNNTDNTENVKQKSCQIQVMKQNDSKENMKVLDSIEPNNEETLNNKSSEVKAISNSNQEKAAFGDKDGDMTDKLDDMNLKERKKKMSGGFGKADVAFPAEDSPMDDSEQTEDIKDMDEDSMDASRNKKEQEDISVTIIKRSSNEESKKNIEVKQEKSETDISSLNISASLKKEVIDFHEKKNKKEDKERKEVELEEMLSKIDEEDKESQDEEKRGKKKKKGVYLEDEYLNDDSRDAMSEEDMLHVRGGKRKSSGSDLFAVASPFVPESNPCSPASTHYGDENDAEKAYRAWKKPIMILWNEIAAHKYASVFLRPITDEQAPGYHDVVHRPMDLKTIKGRIENGTITNTSEFQRDIMLMFLNATMYNTSDHNVYQMATRMMRDTVSSIEEFRTTQMLARASDTPVKSLRRETRESSAKRGDDDPKRKGFETPEIKKRRL